VVTKKVPKISIVTPVFNAVRFIRPCIESVLTQGYADLEYLVIDGGSTDGTVEVIREYSSRLSYWVSERDRGQTDALNKGFSRATGDAFGWLNADEMYLPGSLALVGNAFHDNPGLDLAFGNRIAIDVDGNELRRDRVPNIPPRLFTLYAHGLLLSDATFWSRRAHGMTGVLDEEWFPQLSMDYDWMLRLSMNCSKWVHLQAPISRFVEHGDRKTKDGALAERDSHRARVRVIQAYSIPQWRLLAGWLIAGPLTRIGRWGFRSLLRAPRSSTVRRMLGRDLHV
jgi:glycosyltransferase involved in cell wall biosynthesis